MASREEEDRVKGTKKRRKSVWKLTPWILNYSQQCIDIYEHWGSRAEIKDIGIVWQTYSGFQLWVFSGFYSVPSFLRVLCMSTIFLPIKPIFPLTLLSKNWGLAFTVRVPTSWEFTEIVSTAWISVCCLQQTAFLPCPAHLLSHFSHLGFDCFFVTILSM